MHQVIAGNLLASTKLFIFYLGCKTRFAGGLRMTAEEKLQKSKTDIPSFGENRRIWNRRFCCKHNDSISSASFVAIGRWNIMFALLLFRLRGAHRWWSQDDSSTSAAQEQKTGAITAPVQTIIQPENQRKLLERFFLLNFQPRIISCVPSENDCSSVVA